MIPPFYTAWMKSHCELLAINNGDYKIMLKKLWDRFEKHGVGPGELADATERFIHRPDQVKEVWGSHFGYLMQHIKDGRKETATKAEYAKRKQEEARWKAAGNNGPINSDYAKLLAGKLGAG